MALLASLVRRDSTGQKPFESALDTCRQAPLDKQVKLLPKLVSSAAKLNSPEGRSSALQGLTAVCLNNPTVTALTAFYLPTLAHACLDDTERPALVSKLIATDCGENRSAHESVINALGSIAQIPGLPQTTLQTVLGYLNRSTQQNQHSDIQFQVVHALGKIVQGNLDDLIDMSSKVQNEDLSLSTLVYRLVEFSNGNDKYVRKGAIEYLAKIESRLESHVSEALLEIVTNAVIRGREETERTGNADRAGNARRTLTALCGELARFS